VASYVRWVLLAAAYLAAGQFAFIASIQKPGVPEHVIGARLPELVDGTANRPFVYRRALPAAISVIEAVVPISARQWIEAAIGDNSHARRLLDTTPADEDQSLFLYLSAYLLQLAALLGFAIVLRASVRSFLPSEQATADWAPVVALVLLPIFYRYVCYPNDFPHLFLFTWAWLELSRSRWRWYYPLFVLCCFSKETAILLPFAHALGHFPAMPRQTWIKHGLIQLALFVVIQSIVRAQYSANPGAEVEWWLGRNWALISDLSKWGFLFFHFTFVGSFSAIVPTNFNLLFLLLVPLVLWRWREKPLFLRRSIWLVPILVGATFFFGYIDELRDYYEAFPIVFLLIVTSMAFAYRGTSNGEQPVD
jgi:hypothetical protein